MTLRQWFGPVFRAHDAVTHAGFLLAQLCLLIIVAAYSYEIVARYLFGAPTWWSNEAVAYAICIGTFLALPEVTRRRGHIAITFVIETLPKRFETGINAAIPVIAASTCLVIGWICLEANLQHWARGEMLVRVRPVPKLWLSVFLTYGFVSAGLHFARQIGVRPAAGGAIV